MEKHSGKLLLLRALQTLVLGLAAYWALTFSLWNGDSPDKMMQPVNVPSKTTSIP